MHSNVYVPVSSVAIVVGVTGSVTAMGVVLVGGVAVKMELPHDKTHFVLCTSTYYASATHFCWPPASYNLHMHIFRQSKNVLKLLALPPQPL